MSDTVRIEFQVNTGLQGSQQSDVLVVDRAEWAAMTEAEREAMVRDAAFEYVEWTWSVAE